MPKMEKFKSIFGNSKIYWILPIPIPTQHSYLELTYPDEEIKNLTEFED